MMILHSKRQCIHLLIFVLVFVVASSCSSTDDATEPRIDNRIVLIYDGDVAPDPCDFGTLSMLHEYHSRDMIDLVGVIGATPDPYLVSTLKIYNQLYDHNIPIGAYSEGSDDVGFDEKTKEAYRSSVSVVTYKDQNKTIFERYGDENSQNNKEILGAIDMYRKLLSEADDDSITIYAAGPLFNFPGLLNSPADQYSSLPGEELIKMKVREFVFMGGYFPSSFESENPIHAITSDAEYNWFAFGTENLTKTTLDRLVSLNKPMIYVGYEVGWKVSVGQDIVNRLGRAHPTSEAYFQYRFTYDEEIPDVIADNPAFDEVALFYIVEGGVGTYFDEVFGTVQIDQNGANSWSTEEGNQRYITLLPGAETKLRDVITDRVTGQF